MERWRSVNQQAQLEGDTTANAAKRIRANALQVKDAWRAYAYEHDTLPTVEQLVTATGFPVEYIVFICGSEGYALHDPVEACLTCTSLEDACPFPPEECPTFRAAEPETDLPWPLEDTMLPFCACGHSWSQCDGSRQKCWRNH